MTAQEARALLAQQCARWPGLTAQALVKARCQAALEGTARRAALYREDAKRFGASDVLFVLFGETGAATLAPADPASLMEKLFGRKKKTGIAPSLWCPDIYDATEAQ